MHHIFLQVRHLTGTLVHQNSSTYRKAVPRRRSARRSDQSICLTALTSGMRIGLARSVVLVTDATTMLL